jgi:hypothetical protein
MAFDPRSGFFGMDFLDYATPVGDSLKVAFGNRHRLEKKDPTADVGEAVEPIVYYVDRGAPEPIRTALVEGAAWWNQAFEAAGYQDAFQVRLLPEDADPMDVRYNVIQWVHRSTRGWSYGGGIFDPRTGEIMKGHTLGLGHNMAASTQGRASVMDYPHPLIKFDEDGELDVSDAYDVGIGEWDKRAIIYGYQDFPDGTDAEAGRDQIMADTIDAGFLYVNDDDARAIGSAHPLGNLWDNGTDSIEELNHLLNVRAYALGRFSERNIRPGQPMATLEEVLVPLYLLHRFQLNAVGKLVGGHEFTYAMRGDGQEPISPVSADPENVLDLIPPRPLGNPKSRETFPTSTGKVFESIGAAQSAASLTLEVLLDPSRAARMISSSARNALMPGFDELTNDLLQASWYATQQSGIDGEIQRTTNNLVLEKLMLLAINTDADTQARAIALDTITRLDAWLGQRVAGESNGAWRAHYGFARYQIERMRTDPASIEATEPVVTPPGEPIGTTLDWN